MFVGSVVDVLIVRPGFAPLPLPLHAPSGEDQMPISGCGNLLKIQLMRACLLPFKCLLNRKGKIRAKSKNTFHLVFHP